MISEWRDAWLRGCDIGGEGVSDEVALGNMIGFVLGFAFG